MPELNSAFPCPLRGPCLRAARTRFRSFAGANWAVARYQVCAAEDRRDHFAHELFLRYLPLIRKTLARFCAWSRCYRGACLVEDLVGETYPLFRRALDRFRSPVGVDFVGYLTDRLYWGLEHEVRRIKGSPVVAETEAWPESGTSGDEECRLHARILSEQLLDCLTAREAALVSDHVSGYTHRELAEAAGVSEVSVRKRLERARRRLREFANAS